MKLKKEHFIEIEFPIELPIGVMLVPMSMVTGNDEDIGVILLPKNEEDYNKIKEQLNEYQKS